MIPVTKTFLPPINEYQAYLNNIWETGQLTNNGPLKCELEDKLKLYLKVNNLNLVSSGTLALQVAIKAMGLKGEVITTPFSYVATTNAIIWENCQPVFVDIDPQTFCINAQLIEKSITSNTSAILATHVYGYPCDVVSIELLAKKYNLKVLYDSAHAFGVRLNGRALSSYGDCSALSFHATKLFHTTEGGAIVSRNADISKKIFLLTKFGHLGEDSYVNAGINAKLSELHSAMGLANLPYVDANILRRKECSALYDESLRGVPLIRPYFSSGLEYNYSYYPIVFSTDDNLMSVRAALNKHQIFPRRYFYPSLNTLPFLAYKTRKECPVSENIASKVLCLPLYPELKNSEIYHIAKIIKSAIVLS